MLPKEQRLKKNIQFSATYRLKRSLSNNLLILYVGKEKEFERPTKVGFVISKKLDKRAAKRNKAKRRMREAYRNALKNGDIDTSQKWISLIFLARKEVINADYEQIYKALVNCINRASKRF